ncbi:ribosomal protein, L10 [Nesidiocoris tenuis]|uniref:Large ribosomal subunit protein uL10m n=1 Tax=Nesidiocoris tenuis TaxID=355587 RepID=A0ABN7ACH4_9HEMI|nr:ribosomal protein, L10 [Nesidiocoris tenuis]
MAAIAKSILQPKWSPSLQFVRWRRVNVQRPRPPHYDRALALAVLKPQYAPSPYLNLPKSETCKKAEEDVQYKTRPDNPLERIYARELRHWLETKKFAAFLHSNPIAGDELFDTRVKLKKEGMTLEVYSKHTVKLAVADSPYEAILQLYVAHNAIVFSDEPKVGKLLKIMKKIPQFVVLAGMVEGRLLSVTQLENYANLGDVTSARAQLVGTLNSAGSSLISRLNQAPSSLVSRLDQYADLKKDGS